MFLFWDLAMYLWLIVFLTVLTSVAWVFDTTNPDMDLFPTKLLEFLFFFNNFELYSSQCMTRLCKVIFSYSILKGVQHILFLRNRWLIWIRYTFFSSAFLFLEYTMRTKKKYWIFKISFFELLRQNRCFKKAIWTSERAYDGPFLLTESLSKNFVLLENLKIKLKNGVFCCFLRTWMNWT